MTFLMILGKIGSGLLKFMVFSYEKLGLLGCILVLLVVGLGIQTYRLKQKDLQITSLQGQLAGTILKPGNNREVTIKNNTVTDISKKGVVIKYVPSELKTQIIEKDTPETVKKLQNLLLQIDQVTKAKTAAEKNPGGVSNSVLSEYTKALDKMNAEKQALIDQLQNLTITTPSFGFCLKTGINGLYSKQFLLGLDEKFVVWNRYSLGAGINQQFAFAWVSRHLDDFLPWPFDFQNMEMFFAAGLSFDSAKFDRIGIGIRANL